MILDNSDYQSKMKTFKWTNDEMDLTFGTGPGVPTGKTLRIRESFLDEYAWRLTPYYKRTIFGYILGLVDANDLTQKLLQEFDRDQRVELTKIFSAARGVYEGRANIVTRRIMEKYFPGITRKVWES